MKLKYRRIITRIKPIHNIAVTCMYNSGIFYYRKLYKVKHYDVIMKQLKLGKKRKRCFIIGNGPSLCIEDLEKLINEDCIGTNELYRIFDRTKWRPKYYLIWDRYSKSTPDEVANIDCPIVFLGDYYCRFNEVKRKDYICLHQHFNYSDNKFVVSKDIVKKINIAPTVSFGAMQILAYLGYTEIYLLGFDHNYAFEFDEKGRVVTTKTGNAHFYADDIPEDIIANVWGMTKAYEAFAKYAESHGITVKNATRGGKLEVFERIDFDSLFN